MEGPALSPMAVEVWFLEVEKLRFFMPALVSGHKRDPPPPPPPTPPDAHPRQLGLPGEGSWETRTALVTPDPKGLTEWGDWSWEGQPPPRVAR